jgi:hypothetical protein
MMAPAIEPSIGRGTQPIETLLTAPRLKRLIVFETVHAPLIPPLIAAKEFVTADHIGEGRFGPTTCSAPKTK